jgi:hypothetical protein
VKFKFEIKIWIMCWTAGGHKYEAHRAVLAACSDYFRAMFTDAMKESQQKEIVLNGVTNEGLKQLIN